MLNSKIYIILIVALLLAGVVQLSAQTVPPAADEDKLIAVIKSDEAKHKEKVDACRGLALIASGKSIAPLVELLGDEKLSHMARYALETIRDPAVDEAFRDALGKLKGMPLVGVIGSVGVRRDTKAVDALEKMLQDSDAEVAQAAARALGNIGNSAAAKALQDELDNASGQNKLHVCEGLFRCAETAVAEGRNQQAIEIYDRLRKMDAPHQIRGGAVRGAILTRGNKGVEVLREYLHSDSYIMFSAACQTALEMPGHDVTQALASVLNQLPADNQILVIWTLAKRGDWTSIPVMSDGDDKSVRIAAIKAWPQIGDPSVVPLLVDLLDDNDSEISQAAEQALAAMPGEEADGAVMWLFNSYETAPRLKALDLIGRRRMTSSVPALLKAAAEADAEVRPVALKRVGELGSPADFSAVLDLLVQFDAKQDLDAAEQALSAIYAKTDYTSRLTSRLAIATPAQKGALLRVLSVIGGTDALNAVREAAKDSNAQVSDAAIRVMCSWKTADAAPDLLALAQNSSNQSRKIAALRGYINLIRDENLLIQQKLGMSRQATTLIQRDEEKKLLLGALSTIPAIEALSMAMEHLDNTATRDEAAFAAVAIGEQIVEQNPGQVAEALQKVLKATNNRNVRNRARQILDKAKQ